MKKTTPRNRWKDDGRKPILLAPLAAEHSTIRVAAAMEGMPMAIFLLKHGLEAAEKILAKSAK